MVDVEIQSQLLAELERMPLSSQVRVLDFARSLTQSVLPKGASGKDLRRFAGSISKEDCEIMLKASLECRGIDWESWGLPRPPSP